MTRQLSAGQPRAGFSDSPVPDRQEAKVNRERERERRDMGEARKEKRERTNMRLQMTGPRSLI